MVESAQVTIGLPAAMRAAPQPSSPKLPMSIPSGTRVGRYEIRALLGAGGMGEVYLAHDTQLDRPVALKIPSSDITADPDRLSRFLREARAASKISSTHAAHIYEIGDAATLPFIAMEFVEGESLAQRIAARRQTPAEIADLGAQIAQALEEAHARGVTHRDIKPQNVIVTARGQAKVLDFGLAKLTDDTGSEASTRVKTNPGAVMGTVSYMSPEQALGRADVDGRSDIFSLGVVLYEMATGRLPFEGNSVTETIDRIVHAQPEAISRFNYDVPPALDIIIRKALRKNRDERYQTAQDMRNDLRALGGELKFETSDRFATDGAALAPVPRPTLDGSTPAAAAPGTTSSAEYIVHGIRRHKVAAVVALAGLAGLAFVLYQYAGRRESAAPVFQDAQFSRITTSGRAQEANISPDGKYVVYLEMADDGNRSLWIKQTATGNTLQIVPPTKGNVLRDLSFSPDGNFVYYLFTDRTKPLALYQVPAIGGTPKKVLDDLPIGYAVSPDGQRIAFSRWKDSTSTLVVKNMDGTGERIVATLPTGEWFSDAGPAWSADGRTIASSAGSAFAGVQEFRLLAIDAQTGGVKELSPKRWANAGRVVWMPDGSALALVAMERVEEARQQVWRVSYPGGEAGRVTNDVQGRSHESLGVTADGRTLLTVTGQTLSRIQTVPASGDVTGAARLTVSEANQEGFHGFDWSPDGRIVFSSFEDGQSDLWVMNADGGARRRLTSDTHMDAYPSVSADGRYIVFQSNRPKGAGVSHLWRMDVDGSHLVQLTTGVDGSPQVAPDSRWVIYVSWSASEGMLSLSKVSIDGGPPVRVTDFQANSASYSPDGQWILCYGASDAAKPDDWRYAVIPASGGRPVRQFNFPGFQYQSVRWTPDSRDLSFIGTPPDPSNIWLQPVGGGEPRKLTDFKADYIFRHAWSRDGKTLALVRGRGTSDVVLMRDER